MRTGRDNRSAGADNPAGAAAAPAGADDAAGAAPGATGATGAARAGRTNIEDKVCAAQQQRIIFVVISQRSAADRNGTASRCANLYRNRGIEVRRISGKNIRPCRLIGRDSYRKTARHCQVQSGNIIHNILIRNSAFRNIKRNVAVNIRPAVHGNGPAENHLPPQLHTAITDGEAAAGFNFPGIQFPVDIYGGNIRNSGKISRTAGGHKQIGRLSAGNKTVSAIKNRYIAGNSVQWFRIKIS